MTKHRLPAALIAFLLVSCSDDPSTSVDAKEASKKEIETGLLPEYTPLPDWLTVDEIGWHGDENNYAYKTVSDAEALASIQEVFGVQIRFTEAKIVHSVSDPVRDIHEYGMRLNPRRAKTILDELLASFPKTKAIPGSKFEGWITNGKSKPWGEREPINSSRVYDGLTFGRFDYLTFAHPDYMSPDGSKDTFNRIYVIAAVVDLEDGDFYITLSDWGDD